MTLRRFYNKIEREEVVCQFFFILNTVINKYDCEDCLICFEGIKYPEENVKCHECHKILHLSCVDKWFTQNNMRKCPHCRTNWKFEIDIVEKETEQEWTAKSRSRITIKGSIAGPIQN